MDVNLYNAAATGDVAYLEALTEEQRLELIPSQLAPNGNTILHVVTEFSQLAFATHVANSHRSLVWRQNGAGDTPLHVAARRGLPNFVDLFAGYGTLRLVNCDGDTALHFAAREGMRGCVERLVRADPELCSVVNNCGESPLYLAVAAGFWEVPQAIIDMAPSWASYKGANGLTALHPTLFFPNYDIKVITSLVTWKSEMIKERDNLGMTPLHYAAFYGRTQAINIFLQNQRSAVYILDNDGESALHIAAFRGYIDAMREILNNCPDSCYLVDKKGRTALHAAVLADQKKVEAAVLGDHKKVVKFILQSPMFGQLMNKPDRDGNTPLHLAALFKLYGIIDILVENQDRVNLNAKNKEFLTALDVFNKHDKEGLRPARTRHLLNGSAGSMTMQHLASTEIKKMNRETTIDIPPSDSTETKIEGKNTKEEKPHSDKQNALEVNLLVAALVATVTFAAGRLSLPSGNFEDEKTNIVDTNVVAFQVFVVFNNLAFCCSVFAVLLQLHPSMKQRERYIGFATLFTTVAILAMFITFSVGVHMAVLPRSSLRFSITPFIICGCFAFLFMGLPFCDPGVEGFSYLRRPQKFVRGLIIRHIGFAQ